MPETLKRKPRNQPTAVAGSEASDSPAPAKRSQQLKDPSDAPIQTAASRKNLTLADWLAVYAFMDQHPTATQSDVVRHFAALHSGALIFDQSTLSRKLRNRAKMESRVNDHPNALSSKRPRVVTSPEVERALVLWVQRMEHKGETVTGPMLRTKRQRFEEELGIPEEERLHGDGWVASFCKTYNIREHRRHGEAGSVDTDGVMEDRKRYQKILAQYAPRDRWNYDETSFFPNAPPDRGLATRQMSGKKQDRFRISVGLACNADGSEKLEPMFIGRAKMPRCFQKQSPEQRGFYYRHNKKAWMTGELFEEWLKKFDQRMRQQHRHICLFVDNFSGHNVSYQPSNIRLEFFSPNQTSFVQPCDAGIIRCFKAIYRRNFCMHALDRDDAGEREIYKINLLEGMTMAKDAWNQVTARTIANCWNHTKIQPEPSEVSSLNPPHADPIAWDIIRNFATSDMSLPQAEDALQARLGRQFVDSDWRPALKAIMDAEDNVDSALEAIETLHKGASSKSRLKIRLPPRAGAASSDSDPNWKPDQTKEAEEVLYKTVHDLHSRKRIFGTPPTINEIVDPAEERVGEDWAESDGSIEGIAEQVREEMERGGGEEIIGDNDDIDEEPAVQLTRADLMTLCRQLEEGCMQYGEPTFSLALSHQLCKFRATLLREELLNAKQTTLHDFFS